MESWSFSWRRAGVPDFRRRCARPVARMGQAQAGLFAWSGARVIRSAGLLAWSGAGVIWLAGLLAWSGEAARAAPTPDFGGRDLAISVKGLVCETCAEQMVRRLERNPAVDRAGFDLSHHLLRVHLRLGRKLSDQRIADIVGDAGYPVGEIDRRLASQKTTERPIAP